MIASKITRNEQQIVLLINVCLFSKRVLRMDAGLIFIRLIDWLSLMRQLADRTDWSTDLRYSSEISKLILLNLRLSTFRSRSWVKLLIPPLLLSSGTDHYSFHTPSKLLYITYWHVNLTYNQIFFPIFYLY